jgi:hypothetical protein
MATRKNKPFKEGELELILSLTPTTQHIEWLSNVLERTPGAIEVIYRKAYGQGRFSAGDNIMQRKVDAAKKVVGLVLGRKNTRRK